MNQPRYCPALFISAPASGQGKTTVTAALARYHADQGRTVRVFKIGPDYLDPLILQHASGWDVEPLDLWMMGESGCREALYNAAQHADLILIEGAMGLFDGTPSSADVAIRFGIPVVAVINVKGMAQSVAALAYGLTHFCDDIDIAGVVANQTGSPRHAALIKEALSGQAPLLATLPREDSLTLPARHLGLIPPDEAHSLDAQIEAASDLLANSPLAALPQAVVFHASERVEPIPPLLEGIRIAIACDAAFSFIYPANIRLLEKMGATLRYFSPLKDTQLPKADALWFPGGYPELHLDALAANTALAAEIHRFHQTGKPILAECGGMLYLLESLTSLEGKKYPMLNLLQGYGEMHTRSGCQGMQSAPLPEGVIRGHAHHRSRSYAMPAPIAYGQRPSHPAPGEEIYRERNLTASYIHLFFPSNPYAVARLFSYVDEPSTAHKTATIITHFSREDCDD